MGTKCEGRRKDGEQCGAWALTGRKVCAGHAGMGAIADPVANGAIGRASRTANAHARKEERKLSLLDRIARQTEERAAEIVGAYLAAGLERGDWRALEALVTRVHGRPVERVEIEAPADPLGVASMSADERQALRARLLAEHPHLAAIVRTPDVQH
jgi:hypothetical protein